MITIKFCIATVTYWTEKGYNPSTWRKSVDGTKAMCHLEYGEILAKNLEDNPNVQIFDCASDEFQTLLASSEWVQGGADELVEDNSMANKVVKLEKRTEDLELGMMDIMLGGEM